MMNKTPIIVTVTNVKYKFYKYSVHNARLFKKKKLAVSLKFINPISNFPSYFWVPNKSSGWNKSGDPKRWDLLNACNVINIWNIITYFEVLNSNRNAFSTNASLFCLIQVVVE